MYVFEVVMKFHDLPNELILQVYDRCLQVDAISLAGVDKRSLFLFGEYLHSNSTCKDRRKDIDELCKQVFKCHLMSQKVCKYWILEASSPLDDLAFMIDSIDDDTIVHMNNRGLLTAPDVYPEHISVEKLCKLPKSLVLKIWIKKFHLHDVDDLTFNMRQDKLTDEEKKPVAKGSGLMGQFASLMTGGNTQNNAGGSSPEKHGESPGYHFNKMTIYILGMYRDQIIINDKFLRLMCYWSLYMAFVDVFRLRRFFGFTIEELMPWTLLFRNQEAMYILECISEDLAWHHYRYYHRYMPLESMVYLTSIWTNYSEFQKFIRTLPAGDEYRYWLKDKGRKFVKPVIQMPVKSSLL